MINTPVTICFAIPQNQI